MSTTLHFVTYLTLDTKEDNIEYWIWACKWIILGNTITNFTEVYVKYGVMH